MKATLTGALTRLAEELFARCTPARRSHLSAPPWRARRALPPTESDLRTLPLTMANALAGSAPSGLIEHAAQLLPSLTPYFLGIAGHPTPAIGVAAAGAPEISPGLSSVSEFQPQLVPGAPLDRRDLLIRSASSEDFPISSKSACTGRRAGLAGQRGHNPEAARGHRAPRLLLRARGTPTSTAPRMSWRPGPRTPTSPRETRPGALLERPVREEHRLQGARNDRGDQPGRPELGTSPRR